MNIRSGYLLVLLIAITLGVYYPTVFAPFNSLDDQVYVTTLLNQTSFSFADHFNPGGGGNYFRPLISLSFQADKYFGGLEESIMHFFNILIHTVNAVLIYFLARNFSFFVGYSERLLPWITALLFALHPLNSEAVNWILARTDLLAGLFVFASLICLLKSVQKHNLLWGVVGAILYLCGALCKETALFALPGILLVMVWKPAISSKKWNARWFVPGFYLVAASGYFLMRMGAFTTDRGLGHTKHFLTQAAGSSSTQVASAFSFFDAVGAIFKASGFYAVKLFQPFPLNYAITQIHWTYIPIGCALLVALLVLVVRRQPVGVFFVTSAGIGISALFVMFIGLAWTPIAERYMYVPSGPFAIALIYGGYYWVRRRSLQKVAGVTAFMVLVSSAWATAQRNIIWQDNLTLYQDTVEKSPDFPRAKNELAIALYAKGRDLEAEALVRTTQFQTSQLASLNLAALYIEQGDYQAARTTLVDKLENENVIKTRVLEMLIRNASEKAEKTTDESQKRFYYNEMLDWLNQLEHRTGNPFVSYRKGRVYLILDDRGAAQASFAIAARGLPEDSVYKAPATRLARTLIAFEGQ